MGLKIAFAGFRHGHILELYNLAKSHQDVTLVGACEEHEPTRAELEAAGKVQFTHATYEDMFAQAEIEAIAVGDYYGRRGEVIIRSLRAGKHVISDKPICTSLKELDTIAKLAHEKKLCVGCQLSLRDDGNFLALRELIRSGKLGEIHTITFSGQHPLLWGKRPEWYFEEGKHGGTINDIGIHGVDAIGWLTGRKVASVVSARAWNARLEQAEHFQDAAQFMLKLDNKGGVLADVSYLAPDSCGYKVPQYWRFTVHGSSGMAETNLHGSGVTFYTNDSDQPQQCPAAQPTPGGYFESFLREIAGQSDGLTLTTAEVLESSKIALTAQLAADKHMHDARI
jgi:predicted dehydrogenase